MTYVNSELYFALREAGASEEKARAAGAIMASVTATLEHPPARSGVPDMRPGLAGIRSELAASRSELAAIRDDLRILKWQVGTLAAAVALIGALAVWLAFEGAAKGGALPG